ncbi:NAD(P)-dependent oxidoreductase [candidate division WOR-3 bacterium]|nr:NAD(P)-dependent oxidoreductase [candidate division WOR-3 bacterium]
MRILVIGAAGFIGQFLARRLAEDGHAVVGLDVNPNPPSTRDMLEYRTGDLCAREDVLAAAKGADLIITLAAKHHDFGVSREEFFHVNETGTEILLEVAGSHGIKKLVFYSTVAVYGTRNEPSTEDMEPRPDSDYGASKYAGEILIYKWCNGDKHRSAVIIRPTVIFGPNNYANVYNLIDTIYKRKFIFVGKGDNIKSVAYVENLVDATLFLMDRMNPGIQIYNYSDEPQMTIEQIVETITGFLPHGIPKKKIPLWLVTSFGSIFDCLARITGRNYRITSARMKKFATSTHHRADKIRALGFRQRIDTKEGFRRMVEWYLATQVNK